jgi:periplasmic protein TonB
MSDPRRLLETQGDGEGTALTLAVLRSARGETAPPQAKRRLLEALDIGEVAASAAETSGSRPEARARLEKRTMFDSVLNRGNVAKSRFGTGATFSAIAHVALLGLAVYISSRPADPKKKDVNVTFVQAAPVAAVDEAPPPPPPPPPPKRSRSTPKIEKVDDYPDPVKKPDTIVEAKEEATEKAVDVAEVTPKGGDEGDDGVEGGVEGGVKGGVVGGVIGGKVGSTTPIPPQNVVIPFGAGMNRPSMVSGRDPTYTKDALAARVEGLMIVRCTITVAGAITNCRVIKEVPHMKQAVLDALYTRRYTPVMFNGQAVNVEYVFNIKLVLPSR